MRASLLLLMLPAAAVAQDRDGASRAIDELAGCRAIAAAADRLACFDRISDRIAGARRSGELIVVDRAKVVERKRARFGLASAPSEMFGGGPEDERTEVRELESTLRNVGVAAYGRYNLELANGMVWQTVDTLQFPPRVGAPITLKVTPFGGYRAMIKGEKSVLAKRVR